MPPRPPTDELTLLADKVSVVRRRLGELADRLGAARRRLELPPLLVPSGDGAPPSVGLAPEPDDAPPPAGLALEPDDAPPPAGLAPEPEDARSGEAPASDLG